MAEHQDEEGRRESACLNSACQNSTSRDTPASCNEIICFILRFGYKLLLPAASKYLRSHLNNSHTSDKMVKSVKVIPHRGTIETLPGSTSLLCAFAIACILLPWLCRERIRASGGRPLRKVVPIKVSSGRQIPDHGSRVRVRNWRLGPRG